MLFLLVFHMIKLRCQRLLRKLRNFEKISATLGMFRPKMKRQRNRLKSYIWKPVPSPVPVEKVKVKFRDPGTPTKLHVILVITASMMGINPSCDKVAPRKMVGRFPVWLAYLSGEQRPQPWLSWLFAVFRGITLPNIRFIIAVVGIPINQPCRMEFNKGFDQKNTN